MADAEKAREKMPETATRGETGRIGTTEPILGGSVREIQQIRDRHFGEMRDLVEAIADLFAMAINEAISKDSRKAGDIAFQAGVLDSTLSKYRAGAQLPELGRCLILADILGFSLDALLAQAQADSPTAAARSKRAEEIAREDPEEHPRS